MSEPPSYHTDPRLFLYTSLTSGSSAIITATARLQTILNANRIPFVALDLATDDKARMLWARRAAGKKLPGLVRQGMFVADLEQIEEWNEYGEIKANLLQSAANSEPTSVSLSTAADQVNQDTAEDDAKPLESQSPFAEQTKPEPRSDATKDDAKLPQSKFTPAEFAKTRSEEDAKPSTASAPSLSDAMRQLGFEAAKKAEEAETKARKAALEAMRASQSRSDFTDNNKPEGSRNSQDVQGTTSQPSSDPPGPVSLTAHAAIRPTNPKDEIVPEALQVPQDCRSTSEGLPTESPGSARVSESSHTQESTQHNDPAEISTTSQVQTDAVAEPECPGNIINSVAIEPSTSIHTPSSSAPPEKSQTEPSLQETNSSDDSTMFVQTSPGASSMHSIKSGNDLTTHTPKSPNLSSVHATESSDDLTAHARKSSNALGVHATDSTDDLTTQSQPAGAAGAALTAESVAD